MRKIYMPKHINFLGKKIIGRSYREVTLLFNERFGFSATESAIKALVGKNGLGNNHGSGVLRVERRKYLPHHIRFLKGIVKGRSYAEITRIFNREFGFTVSVKALSAFLKKHNLKNGLDGRFHPGQIPHNKGRKGYCSPGSEKGWFRPGHPGYKWKEKPVGSERVNADGYVEVKYSDKPCTTAQQRQRRWKGKHILVWEKANGPVPKGHAVIFVDGNRRNFKLKNLALVSRKELAVLNHAGMLSSKNEDITKLSVNIARLKVLVGERKRDTLETRSKKKLVVIDNRGSRIVIMRDPKTGRYFSVRETKFGPRRLKASLKSRKTEEEARGDLIAYALKRGWQRA
jgi:hypothetical protein